MGFKRNHALIVVARNGDCRGLRCSKKKKKCPFYDIPCEDHTDEELVVFANKWLEEHPKEMI